MPYEDGSQEAIMSKDIIGLSWHSSIGVDSIAASGKRVIKKLPNSKKARSMFIGASCGKFLIHKSSQALWRVSEDGGSIEPVFDSDVLSEDDLKEQK
jgi:hypothetical protein